MANSENKKPGSTTDLASASHNNSNEYSDPGPRIRQLEGQLRALLAEHQSTIVQLENNNRELQLQLTKCALAEQALLKTEQLIRSIVNTAADAIISINSQGIIEHFNLAAEKMFGYSADEAIGCNINILMPSPYREKHQQYLNRALKAQHSYVIGFTREIVAQRKSGQIFPIELSVSQMDHHKCCTGIIRDLSWNKKLERQLLTIADETQREIGQNLHDDIGQEMTGLALKTEALQALVSHKDKAGQTLIADIISGLDRTRNKISVLSRGLIPVAVDARGLMVALEELASKISTVYGVSCTFSSTRQAGINNNTIATQLFHIAQEAINNAIRHGQARHIQIQLNKNGQHFNLSIQDDGKGFAGIGRKETRRIENRRKEARRKEAQRNEAERKEARRIEAERKEARRKEARRKESRRKEKGMGLHIMEYRSRYFGGKLSIEAGKTGGVIVNCSFEEEDDDDDEKQENQEKNQ
ncbi:MAG: PAS domain S-box protein [Gammaproteobacteria bacterium]|nr:PAS domain S-box protein [Gammaproteobacteria bacterium]